MKKTTKWIIGGAVVLLLSTGLSLGHVFRHEIKDWVKGFQTSKPSPVDPKPPVQLTCLVSVEIHRPDGVEKESQEVETGYELELPDTKEMDEIEGYIARYFYVTGSGYNNRKLLGGQTITITSDTKITVSYEKIITIAFDVDGDIEFQEVIEGDSPFWRTPSKVGMNFDGWTLDRENVIDLSKYEVTEFVTFIAKFSYKYYTVDFILSDTMKVSCNYRSDNQLYIPTPLPVEGKDCLGWSKDNENVFDFACNLITEDTTFHPIYIDQEFVESLPFAIENGEVTGYFGESPNVIIPSHYSIDSRGNIIEGNDFNIVKIRENAFSYNQNITSVEVMPGIAAIEDYAFYRCSNLESVKIHDGVFNIGNFAFAECESLTSIELPSSVSDLNGYTFCQSENLQQIKIAEDNFTYKSEGLAITSKDGTHLVFATKNAVIPDSVIVIDDYAFVHSKIKEIVLPDNVTTIKEYALMGCNELTSLTLSQNFIFDWQSQRFLREFDKFETLVIKNKLDNASNLFMSMQYIPKSTLTNVYVPDEYYIDYLNDFQMCPHVIVNTLSSLESKALPAKCVVHFRSPLETDVNAYNYTNYLVLDNGSIIGEEFRQTPIVEGYIFSHWVRQDLLTMEEVEVVEDIQHYTITENTIFKAIFTPVS